MLLPMLRSKNVTTPLTRLATRVKSAKPSGRRRLLILSPSSPLFSLFRPLASGLLRSFFTAPGKDSSGTSAAPRSSRDMQASIATAREANRISAEALHASQRAWLNEETVMDSDLVWSQNGCEFVIKTNVKNIGTVPAQDVIVDAKIIATRR